MSPNPAARRSSSSTLLWGVVVAVIVVVGVVGVLLASGGGDSTSSGGAAKVEVADHVTVVGSPLPRLTDAAPRAVPSSLRGGIPHRRGALVFPRKRLRFASPREAVAST